MNYSISIKALSWAVFFGHIFNAFFGFLSILIFLKLYEKKKKTFFVFFYIIINVLNFLITEGALVYPIISLLIYLTLYRFNLKGIFFLLSPVLIYIFIVFTYTGKFLPLLSDRIHQNDKEYELIFNKNNETDIYFYRSTFAPRNFKGYAFRIIDNISSSTNTLSIEKSLKHFDTQKRLEKVIKNYLKLFIFLFIFFLLILIFLVYKHINKIERSKNYLEFIFIYLAVLLIYTLIFFRKDINFPLSFFSSLIISKILYDLYFSRSKLLMCTILALYIVPTITYASTNFRYFGDFTTDKARSIFYEYQEEALKNQPNKDIKTYYNFKYFYYYYNFQNNRDYLKKYKNLTLREFFKEFN